MPLILEKYEQQRTVSWNAHLAFLEQSMKELEMDIDEAATNENQAQDYCAMVEHVINDLNRSIHAINKLKMKGYHLYSKSRKSCRKSENYSSAA
ncbi:hypothetical protein SAMN05660653_02604 [Desulfonatronum thiosulfatophilum]|uniref:Uncharacterized protein n=1 Tax=Desulfonatronum thiosulfatophilum TaxID=617002 RepID=A0A1G6E436_9BACT|nr:hypothetical protein [Desulfonatronum thiosulfatophilum]SDB52217.1 hypothetical protein SAMN05660653_02604 [Desulfonatronum thiosulfatophilum]